MKAGTIVALALAMGAGIACTNKRAEKDSGTQAQQDNQAQQQAPNREYSLWDLSQGKQPPARTMVGTGAPGEEVASPSATKESGDKREGVADFGVQVPPAHEKQTGIVNGRLAAASDDGIEVRTREGEQLQLQVPAEALVVIEGAVAGVNQLETLDEGTPVRVVYSIQNGTNVVTNVEATATSQSSSPSNPPSK